MLHNYREKYKNVQCWVTMIFSKELRLIQLSCLSVCPLQSLLNLLDDFDKVWWGHGRRKLSWKKIHNLSSFVNISSWIADRLAHIAEWKAAIWSEQFILSLLLKTCFYWLSSCLGARVNDNPEQTWTLEFISEQKRWKLLPFFIIWHNHSHASQMLVFQVSTCLPCRKVPAGLGWSGRKPCLFLLCCFLQPLVLGITGQGLWASHSTYLHTALCSLLSPHFQTFPPTRISPSPFWVLSCFLRPLLFRDTSFWSQLFFPGPQALGFLNPDSLCAEE